MSCDICVTFVCATCHMIMSRDRCHMWHLCTWIKNLFCNDRIWVRVIAIKNWPNWPCVAESKWITWFRLCCSQFSDMDMVDHWSDREGHRYSNISNQCWKWLLGSMHLVQRAQDSEQRPKFVSGHRQELIEIQHIHWKKKLLSIIFISKLTLIGKFLKPFHWKTHPSKNHEYLFS